MKPRAACPLLIILLALATMAGCGWQLRGSYDLPPALLPIEVDGGDVGNALADTLRPADALAGGDVPASSRIEIIDESVDRRVLAVDARGRAEEYELLYEVQWQLVASGEQASAQRVLIAPRTDRASRSYDYDSGALLSTNEQERALREAMASDLAQRILYRLQAWSAGE